MPREADDESHDTYPSLPRADRESDAPAPISGIWNTLFPSVEVDARTGGWVRLRGTIHAPRVIESPIGGLPCAAAQVAFFRGRAGASGVAGDTGLELLAERWLPPLVLIHAGGYLLEVPLEGLRVRRAAEPEAPRPLAPAAVPMLFEELVRRAGLAPGELFVREQRIAHGVRATLKAFVRPAPSRPRGALEPDLVVDLHAGPAVLILASA